MSCSPEPTSTDPENPTVLDQLLDDTWLRIDELLERLRYTPPP